MSSNSIPPPSSDPRQARWKKRLQSLQSSFRGSFRSKNRLANKDVKFAQQESDESDEKVCKERSKMSGTFGEFAENDASVFWRVTNSEQKQNGLSEMKQKQDHYKPVSTSKVHSMHGKTLKADVRDCKRRKYHSSINLSDTEKTQCRGSRINNHLELNHDENITESLSKQQRSSRKSKSTLFRPKSLNRLSSLFKRSSGSRADFTTNRGNTGESVNSSEVSSKPSTSITTSIDSLDEVLDTDGSYLHLKRYYSLKRSRASLIFPPSERSEKLTQPKLREKSSTFCGAHEPVALTSSSTSSKVNHGVVNNCVKTEENPPYLTRKKRSVSLLVPLSSSTLELTQPGLDTNKTLQSLIGTNYSHLRSLKGSITNIRCITRHLSMSRITNIPSLGVTYIDSDGLEKTLVILSGRATQSCYELFKTNNTVPLPIKLRGEKSKELLTMGNNTGTLGRSASYGDILDRGGSLKPSSSTPDLFSRRTTYTLNRDNQDKKNKVSSMIKGFSLKRNTLGVHSKHDGKKKDKKNKRFGLGSHPEKRFEKEWNSQLGVRLAGSNSLSRSLDCLTELRTNKIPPIHRDSSGLFRQREGTTQMNQYESIQPKNGTTQVSNLDDFFSESEGDDSSIHSNDSSVDSSEYKRTIIVHRGSQPKETSGRTSDNHPSSAPSSVDTNDGHVTSHRRVSPLYNSTPITRMSTLERQRSKSAVSDDPEVPPPVRPRIQSLEELSPVTAEVILRKKKSLASRKIRLKHSISMPSEEYIMTDNADENKRYSLGAQMSDFIGSPVPLTAFKSFSSDQLDSQESLPTNEASSSNSINTSHEKLLTPPQYHSSLRVSLEDISKSPTIQEECERTDSEKISEGNKRTSLSRNQRLGKSTGDLSFEPGASLKRKSTLEQVDGYFEVRIIEFV